MSECPARHCQPERDRLCCPTLNPSPEIATSAAASTPARRPFHILTKPIGPICNLDCQYCFYLEKEKLYPGESRWRMSDEVLEKYIREYIHSQPVNEIHFAWQGGEPTLLGLDFFQKVVHLQKRHAGGKTIANAIQTNGTLINDDWASFLAGENFLVGLSIDGPRELHDRYRVDKQQQPTFDRVVRGLEHLQRRRVEYNTLTVVSRANAFEPLTVYRFLKSIGSQFLQFIPLVERRTLAGQGAEEALASPPHKEEPGAAEVTEWSVPAAQYGTFLCAIFDEWVRRDVGTVFVQLFDTALGNWLGLGSSLCVFAEKCGSALAMEHNGDVYSCDHYVYPRYHLGNILNQSLGSMLHSQPRNALETTNQTPCRLIVDAAQCALPVMVNAPNTVSCAPRTAKVV